MRALLSKSIGCSIGASRCGAAARPRPAVRTRWRPGWLAVPCAVWLLCGWSGAAAPTQPGDGVLVREKPADEQATGVLDATWGVGSWVWSPETSDKQTCRLWRSFEIPAGATVAEADLRIAVDNGYRLLLDGRELGIGSDWRSVTEYNITLLLNPGWHVLAVEAFNDNREAGMLFGLRIDLTDGSKIVIPSDPDWRLVPANERGWEHRHTAPAHWGRAVVVSAFLPRTGGWFAREPTMVVKVPVLRPLEQRFWQHGWFQAALVSAVVVAVLMCLRLMARLAVQSKAQAMLQRERARIARDIHDELGARLTELVLEGEVAQTELPAGSAARSRFEALSERARALSGAMDEVVWMVNSRRDTLRDFATYACKHAQRFLASTPICCRLDVEAELPEVVFELPVRRNLLLAVKEALNNAAKYSGATELFLRIRRRGLTFQVVVEDNGAGFDPEMVDPTRNGLTNMAERMQEVDGRCWIVSSEGTGCRVEFQVPLPKSPTRPAAAGGQGDPPLARVQRGPTTPPTPANRNPKEIAK